MQGMGPAVLHVTAPGCVVGKMPPDFRGVQMWKKAMFLKFMKYSQSSVSLKYEVIISINTHLLFPGELVVVDINVGT